MWKLRLEDLDSLKIHLAIVHLLLLDIIYSGELWVDNIISGCPLGANPSASREALSENLSGQPPDQLDPGGTTQVREGSVIIRQCGAS